MICMSEAARAARAKARAEYMDEVERRYAAIVAEAERRNGREMRDETFFVAVAPIAVAE